MGAPLELLCAAKGAGVAHYALDNLHNKVLAAEYQTVLPDVKRLAEELERTQRVLETRQRHPLTELSQPVPRKRSPTPRKSKFKPKT